MINHKHLALPVHGWMECLLWPSPDPSHLMRICTINWYIVREHLAKKLSFTCANIKTSQRNQQSMEGKYIYIWLEVMLIICGYLLLLASLPVQKVTLLVSELSTNSRMVIEYSTNLWLACYCFIVFYLTILHSVVPTCSYTRCWC